MLKQFLNLKLSQKLSPQQIQLMKLIQLPTQAFEQRLLEEMNENPALEAGKEDEYEADEFAVRKGYDIGNSLIKVNNENKAEVDCDWLVSVTSRSHPSLMERLDAINAAKRKLG